ncbi:uncharacterized protein LOC131146964 isoform X2 [Malania oleifera]|uniref:uncharacterized protein LOC131146964 isoform X2 n=1 Tax=Malania oleifera TaxID=397392 RepID=UPI0025AE70ED|nr:uncharacterized protein LOC131146964 isoform X2 [Malania oleifera]XP_057952846.1 uncharacterized protein LOC131146964 isoform X2 [Malania oleifera]
MPVAKLRACSTPDAMKPEDGNDSLDNFIRQAIGKEPFLSFSRAGDSPVQWIQLLHALDQQDLPGWPLLSPLKVQMQKCEKCSREFCSPINYRRHIRVHRRSLNPDKDPTVNRDLLGAFWDKLSSDEAKEVVSLKNVTLEEVPGLSIVKALTSLIRKPGFSSLPQVYMKAGSALLDIVQARASRFPISSEELFSILDDASEKTFLCGPAVSMQKYIFDGEAGKIGLEMKNLVACTSFLVEQKLVKAWVADKDAEALRCQKLLVEEEEAAQKRKADLLERRRQKKLRQKEQKAKEQANGEKVDAKESMASEPAGELSSSPSVSDSDLHHPGTPPDSVSSFLEPIRHLDADQDAVAKDQYGFSSAYSDSGISLIGENRLVQGSGRRQLVVARWQLPKSQRGVSNGFYATQNPQLSKPGVMQKHGVNWESRSAPIVNGNKIWAPKPKPEVDGECFRNKTTKEPVNQPDQNKDCEVLIGSISVTLGNSSSLQCIDSLVEVRDDPGQENTMLKKSNVQEKASKPDSAQSGMNRSMVKAWRPVSQHETRGSVPNGGNRVSEMDTDVATEKANDRSLSSESSLISCAIDDSRSGSENNSPSPPMEETARPRGWEFSTRAAEAFLAERWKEAISTDHVKLVLSPESEPPGCPDVQNDCQVEAPSSSNFVKRSILGSAENRLANGVTFEPSSATGAAKAKIRTKPEKGVKLKYIPKQRALA